MNEKQKSFVISFALPTYRIQFSGVNGITDAVAELGANSRKLLIRVS